MAVPTMQKPQTKYLAASFSWVGPSYGRHLGSGQRAVGPSLQTAHPSSCHSNTTSPSPFEYSRDLYPRGSLSPEGSSYSWLVSSLLKDLLKGYIISKCLLLNTLVPVAFPILTPSLNFFFIEFCPYKYYLIIYCLKPLFLPWSHEGWDISVYVLL